MALKDMLQLITTPTYKGQVAGRMSGGAKVPSVAPSNASAIQPGGAAGAVGKVDYTWFYWGQEEAANGFTGLTSKAGWPNTYVQSGDTVTFEEQRGQPYILTGFATGDSKCGGGRIKGASSYGATYRYFPSCVNANMTQALANAFMPQPFDRGDVLTGETDSANTNEARIMGVLAAYGAGAHPYPRTVQEVMAYSGISAREIWTPQCSVTSSATITSGSGAATLDSASQEDIWWASDKTYYIIGAMSHLVDNKGFIQVAYNLPAWYNARNVCIPLNSGAQAVTFENGQMNLPYEAIGPFSGTALPQLGLFSADAEATTFNIVLAVV